MKTLIHSPIREADQRKIGSGAVGLGVGKQRKRVTRLKTMQRAVSSPFRKPCQPFAGSCALDVGDREAHAEDVTVEE